MLKKFGHPTVSQRFPHRVQALWSFAEIFVTRMRSCCGNQLGVFRHVVERTLVKRRFAIPTPTPLPEYRRPTPCIRTPSRWGPFPRRGTGRYTWLPPNNSSKTPRWVARGAQELVVGGGRRVQPGPDAIVVELSWACRDRKERPRAVCRGGHGTIMAAGLRPDVRPRR
jgi:hypothetical protein